MEWNHFENWGTTWNFAEDISNPLHSTQHLFKNTSHFIWGTSRIHIRQNLFKNGWAVKVRPVATTICNNFIGNTFDVGTNGTMVLNTFDHNYWDKYEG
jgi:nitrous oxidase accessory protein